MDEKCLHTLHEHELQMLLEVDTICKRHGLCFFLAEGTLLGAVRHNGFIPWDDDLDIAMPRKDYQRFSEIAKNELSEKYYYQDVQSDENYYRIAAKIREKNTLFQEDADNHDLSAQGIYIDIFPLDSCTKSSIAQSIKQKFAYSFHTALSAKRSKAKASLWIRAIAKLSDKKLIKLRDWCFHGKGEYYTNYGSYYGIKKQTILKKCYEPSTYCMFEGHLMPIPCDSNSILSKIYGEDYMVLPPKEKRTTHKPIRLSFNCAEDMI